MTTVAWFHCFAGIAGDMALGSLVDAGAAESEVVALLRRLPVEGWELHCEPVLRGGIACTRAVVNVTEAEAEPGAGAKAGPGPGPGPVPRAGPGAKAGPGPVTRSHHDIVSIVRAATLPDRVERRALAAFAVLAQAEGVLHGVSPTDVHFHEVGGHDAIVDVVGTAAALEVLGVDEVVVSPVAVGTGMAGTGMAGTGMINAAHGALPNPPPAVMRLLEGVPTYGRPVALELTTPTGAALVRSLATSYGPMPAMTIRSSGYGAGAAELDTLPNCTQVVIGESAATERSTGPGQPVTVLEANLDDATGEQLARAVAELLGAGAFDAWITPVVMKKGRPGHTLSVLCDPARAEALAEVTRRATGSFGVRATQGERWPERRRIDEVTVDGQVVRMKVGVGRVKAEPEDVDRIAAATGLGVQEIASRAEEAWRRATS